MYAATITLIVKSVYSGFETKETQGKKIFWPFKDFAHFRKIPLDTSLTLMAFVLSIYLRNVFLREKVFRITYSTLAV